MGQRDRVRNNGTGTKTDKNNDDKRERKTDHEMHRGLEKKREAFGAAQRLRESKR